MKKIKAKISIKIVSNSKVVKSISTRKTRRIFHFIKAEDFQNCLYKLHVSYWNGKVYEGNSQGIYNNKKDLINALEAFLDITD